MYKYGILLTSKCFLTQSFTIIKSYDAGTKIFYDYLLRRLLVATIVHGLGIYGIITLSTLKEERTVQGFFSITYYL